MRRSRGRWCVAPVAKISRRKKGVSYQSTLLLDTYQERFTMSGRFRNLLEPLGEKSGLSSICVAIGLIRNTQGFQGEDLTAEI